MDSVYDTWYSIHNTIHGTGCKAQDVSINKATEATSYNLADEVGFEGANKPRIETGH